jgi:tRNA uridine 5-carbamoylmethylation protein Kti12
MPLILMCGIPGSGKTTRANQIAKYLTEKYKQNVVIVNEEYLKVSKDESYASKFRSISDANE